MNQFFSNNFTLNVIKILLIFFITIILNWGLRSLIKLPTNRFDSRKAKAYITVIRNIVSLILFLIALYTIFLNVGINLTPVFASAGLIGIIAGIGAHSVLDDFIAGFFLTSQTQIAVGDYIRAGGSNLEGTVINIGFKNLTLKGTDGSLIIIPNSQIYNLTNFTYGRANNIIDITVKSTLDIEKLIDIFNQALNKLKTNKNYKIFEGSRVLGVKAISPGSITISTLIFTAYNFRWSVDRDFKFNLLKIIESKKLDLI